MMVGPSNVVVDKAALSPLENPIQLPTTVADDYLLEMDFASSDVGDSAQQNIEEPTFSSRSNRANKVRTRGVETEDSETERRGKETSEDRRMQLSKQLCQAAVATHEELCEIPDDVYSMFFLSSYGGPAFWYAAYVTFLKMALYTFLMMDAVEMPLPKQVEKKVLAAQFLMLPIAVAIQEDLTAFFFTVANVQYSTEIQRVFPDASCVKFYVANFFRGIDGFFSLLVNVVILLKADTVLTLFLNFAALQFLQTIDNIALHLCLDGYLFDRLEQIAFQVTQVKLPRKTDSIFNMFDSLLFMLSLVGIFVAWIFMQFV